MCPPDCELSNSGFASRPGISCVSIGLREPKSQCLWLRYNSGNSLPPLIRTTRTSATRAPLVHHALHTLTAGRPSPSKSRNALAILMHVQNSVASVLEQAWREA